MYSAHCFTFDFAVRSALFSFCMPFFCYHCYWTLYFFSLLRAFRFDMAHIHLYTNKIYTVQVPLFSVLVCACASFHTCIIWYCISYSMAANFLHFAFKMCTFVWIFAETAVSSPIVWWIEKKKTRRCTLFSLFLVFSYTSALSLSLSLFCLLFYYFVYLCFSAFVNELNWTKATK